MNLIPSPFLIFVLFNIKKGGDKILLPPSAFDTLARLNIEYPMLFRIENPEKGTMTHCGVLEFTAEEGTMNIPFWMMQNLLVGEGGLLSITNVSLPKATYVKLQPQHVDFLEITNPRAVLEYALRNFSCVTKGDLICLPYNGKKYEFALKEVKPQDAACIIETDCNVDFDAPLGYKEPQNDLKSGTSAPTSGNSSLATSLASIPKQSAYKDRNSACPSPAMSSMSGASALNQEATEPPKTKIVDGKIIRLDNESSSDSQNSGFVFENKTMMAERTGRTGVQKNAAIAEKAPEIDYWALNAGDGARLDGKAATPLKDKGGNEIDVKKLRAEAAAKRIEAMNAAKNMPASTTGITVGGKVVEVSEGDTKPTPAVPVVKHKSRIGAKYSKIKQGGMAFTGSANHMKK
jgi:ubiquitin fusion degradation protein 1